jgi:hypothetical protein
MSAVMKTSTSTPPQAKPRSSKPMNANTQKIAAFKPRVSHPTKALAITLQTHIAQSVFDTQWYRLHLALYNVIVMCNEAGEEDVAKELATLVDNMTNTLAQDLQEETDRLRLLRKQNGDEGYPDMSMPASHSLELSTPQAVRIIKKVLLPLDQLILEVEALWFDGEIDEGEKKAHAFPFKHAVTRFFNQVIGMQQRSHQSVLRRQEERRARRLDIEARREAKQAGVSAVAADLSAEAVNDAAVDQLSAESPLAAAEFEGAVAQLDGSDEIEEQAEEEAAS